MAQEFIEALHEQDKINQMKTDLELDQKSNVGHTHGEYVENTGDVMTGSLTIQATWPRLNIKSTNDATNRGGLVFRNQNNFQTHVFAPVVGNRDKLSFGFYDEIDGSWRGAVHLEYPGNDSGYLLFHTGNFNPDTKEPNIPLGNPGQIWATNTAGDGKEWIDPPVLNTKIGSTQEESVGNIINNMISLTQVEYDNLIVKEPTTMYIIVG